MLKFPIIPDGIDLPQPRMRLMDYARFSERCLKSNAALTSENCLLKRIDEKAITHPFRFTNNVDTAPPRGFAVGLGRYRT